MKTPNEWFDDLTTLLLPDGDPFAHKKSMLGLIKCIQNDAKKFPKGLQTLCDCGSKMRSPRYEKCYRGHKREMR